MAKQTNWYWILVLTNEGPVFVTSIGEHKTTYWNRLEKPKQFAKSVADDIALGLASNGYMALSVHTRFELTNQPYLYNKGHFEWTWEENKND